MIICNLSNSTVRELGNIHTTREKLPQNFSGICCRRTLDERSTAKNNFKDVWNQKIYRIFWSNGNRLVDLNSKTSSVSHNSLELDIYLCNWFSQVILKADLVDHFYYIKQFLSAAPEQFGGRGNNPFAKWCPGGSEIS